MNKVFYKRLSFVLIVLWLLFIYILSDYNGTVSSKLSSKLLITLTNNQINDITLFNHLHFILRKIAHVFEYIILAVFVYNWLKFYIKKSRFLSISVYVFCLICSIFDEMHQLLVAGRSGKLYDIFIDSIGITLFLVFVYIYKKYATSRKSD